MGCMGRAAGATCGQGLPQAVGFTFSPSLVPSGTLLTWHWVQGFKPSVTWCLLGRVLVWERSLGSDSPLSSPDLRQGPSPFLGLTFPICVGDYEA